MHGEEESPARVGPGSDSAGADAFDGARVEHGDAGGVGAEATGARVMVEISHRREQMNARRAGPAGDNASGAGAARSDAAATLL